MGRIPTRGEEISPTLLWNFEGGEKSPPPFCQSLKGGKKSPPRENSHPGSLVGLEKGVLRRKILHLEVPDPLYYPLQTFVRPRSILLSHITLCCPTVFLCFSQQYLSNCLNSIFRLLPDLRAPCRSRRAVYWPCPALPRMLLLWPPAPTSQKCKVVAANKLFQYIQ